MAPRDDDWSDSDEEDLAEVETSVLLGVPDGPVSVESDTNDVAVSRIGGHPAFLSSSEPPFSSSQCKICSNPMELLVQMWCPLEDSPMDRALYMWGCPRAGCQGQEGTVRAWRGLRYNQQYAAKLEIKLAKKREREKAKADAIAEEERRKASAKINPFSLKGSSAPNPFGLGSQIFGDVSTSTFTKDQPESKGAAGNVNEDEENEDDSDAESITSSSEESLLTAMASTSISDSVWKATPSYPPLYLSTASEYLPPQAKPKILAGVEVIDPSEDRGKSDKDISWASEAYENSMDVDQVFERFSKRVACEPEQCVRYDLKGTPLPFASDAVFKRLFPAPASEPLPVTKPDFTVVRPQKREYDASSIPACPVCKSPRVFECQLMPNLINVLRPKESGKGKQTDEERRKAVERSLKGDNKDERRGMEWGTSMVFSCEKDCCLDDNQKEAKECWREEIVRIQWDV